MYICLYTYIYTHIHTHIHVHVYICLCVHVHIDLDTDSGGGEPEQRQELCPGKHCRPRFLAARHRHLHPPVCVCGERERARESIVGCDFLPRGTGICTRRPLFSKVLYLVTLCSKYIWAHIVSLSSKYTWDLRPLFSNVLYILSFIKKIYQGTAP